MKYRLHLLRSACDASLAGGFKRKKNRPFATSLVSMGMGLEIKSEYFYFKNQISLQGSFLPIINASLPHPLLKLLHLDSGD